MYPVLFTFSRVAIFDYKQFAETEETVYHMETDRYIEGYILFSDGGSLKTSNGSNTVTIAGNSTSKGFHNGIGVNARFELVTDFFQRDPDYSTVLLVDEGNSCFRELNRTNNRVTTFLYSCASTSQSKIASFSPPYKIAISRNAEFIFTSKRSNYLGLFHLYRGFLGQLKIKNNFPEKGTALALTWLDGQLLMSYPEQFIILDLDSSSFSYIQCNNYTQLHEMKPIHRDGLYVGVDSVDIYIVSIHRCSMDKVIGVSADHFSNVLSVLVRGDTLLVGHRLGIYQLDGKITLLLS